MSFYLKIFLFLLFLCLVHSEIEFSSCENDIRKIIFENGTIETFPCLSCPVGQYTHYYEDDNVCNCSQCDLGTSNYGGNIILNSFSKKKLSRYYYETTSECSNDINLCPEWKINPLSLRVDCNNNNIKSKSVFTIKPYYMNDGKLIIKYINYNGGIDKYFNIYINNNIIYKDDSEHSIIKIKYFNIKKGKNEIKFEYNIDNILSSKKHIYDDNSYLEIFEIQMINAETSSLECDKYDTLSQLKNTIHNNCDYYVDKCRIDEYCIFRFYSEQKSEFCNLTEGVRTIKYNKIEGAVCTELINPPDIEVECEHCTYGQYLIKDGDNKGKCDYCGESTYNNKIINDEESCDEICDVVNEKIMNKIFYVDSFADPSQITLNEINIDLYLGYIEIKYEKFNEKENTNIFIEISNLNSDDTKTIELINPEEDNEFENYKFNIPTEKGVYNITIKGKNLKLSKISIKGSENGGNYRCVDKINNEDEEICINEDEHYSKMQEKCLKCLSGTISDANKECIFIEQFIDNKFTLDNSLLNRKVLSTSYNMNYEENEYFLNFNPAFPLIYFVEKNNNINIIGKELHKIKLVKGIYHRGIILSFISKDNEKNYITNFFIKCKKNNLEENENIVLDNIKNTEDIIYYYFSLQTNDSCPYCLNSEVTFNEKTECIHSHQLVDIEINETSLCVIKPFDNTTVSKVINDSTILLEYDSDKIEDKLLISNYEINESIPVSYEKENDEINTAFSKNISCKYKRKSIGEMGTGIILLIIIAGVMLLIIIGIIIWKICDVSRNKAPERLAPSLTELSEKFSTSLKNEEDEKENLKNI